MKKLLFMLMMLAPMAASAQAKFGHVNSQEIIQAMPEFTKARTDIEALAKQYDADLKGMQEEIQKKAEALEKEQATLPANIKQKRCRLLQLRFSMPSSQLVRPTVMFTSWTLPVVFPISALRCLPMLLQRLRQSLV